MNENRKIEKNLYELNGAVIAPPHAHDLEEAVIGSLLLDRESIDRLIPFIPSDFFYDEKHDIVYRAISKLLSESKTVDILTVTHELKNNGELDRIGGPWYVTQLTSRVASSENIEYHFMILLQMYIKRQLLKVSSDTIGQSIDGNYDVLDTLSQIKNKLDGIDDLIARKRTAQDFPDIVDEAVTETMQRMEKAKQGKVIGIHTGLVDLNAAIMGWQPGDVIILAGRPGMGKTAFGLFFAKKAAKYGYKPCFFSLEMTSVRLIDRLILSESGVDSYKYRNGNLSPEDLIKIQDTAAHLKTFKMYVDDNPGSNVSYIHSVCRLRQRRNACDLVVIDYLQLIEQPGSNRNQNRETEVASISRKIKKMALELKVPVILLCQLSRDVEKRGGDRKPRLSDLRESGAIEQDADIVIFPWRPDYYGIKDESDQSLIGLGELIIAKNRHGGLSDVKFRHNPSMNDFSDFASSQYVGEMPF